MHVHLLTGILRGGAAGGAKQLALSLGEQGVDVRLVFPSRLADDVDGQLEPIALPARWNGSFATRLRATIRFRLQRQSFKRRMRRRPPGNAIFSSPAGAPQTRWPPRGVAADAGSIVHLHWIAKLIDYHSFFQSLPAGTPVVWTLHDMNPLTGGCHFSGGCERFRHGCGNCPQLAPRDRGPGDLSHQFFGQKQRALDHQNLHVAAPSRWLIEQAAASPMFRHAKSFHRIPYGLPDRIHAGAIDRAEARRQLGLDPDAFVFCFGATDLGEQRKGARFLVEALRMLGDRVERPVQGLVFGGGHLPEAAVPIRSVGYLSDAASLMRVHSASDVFVLPSTEDNLPFTAIEAMAGGAALLGFDATGIPDLVIDGQTGRLAKPADAVDLADKLCQMIADRSATAHQGRRAKAIAACQYTQRREAEAYRELYQAATDDPASAAELPTSIGLPRQRAAA